MRTQTQIRNMQINRRHTDSGSGSGLTSDEEGERKSKHIKSDSGQGTRQARTRPWLGQAHTGEVTLARAMEEGGQRRSRKSTEKDSQGKLELGDVVAVELRVTAGRQLVDHVGWDAGGREGGEGDVPCG